LLFLVPLCAAAVVVMGVLGKDYRIPALVAGGMPVAGFVYGLLRAGTDLFPRLALGGWLTIAAGAAILLAVLGVLKLGRGRS
jgi:hypothetical protein